MKITQSIERLYDSKHDYYKILERKVSSSISSRKKNSWHFIHRIKSQESFALKLETGRFDEKTIFHDYFACTLVVENLDEIDNAEKLIKRLFEIAFKKPQSNSYTFKNTDSFPFDDLRIYCKLGDKLQGPISPEVKDLIFEVQIKTFLQHAWSIATHDLIYKADKITWGKERIAYQVKAALEQAEVAISGVSDLSKVNELAKENKFVKMTNRTIILISKHFSKDDLPNDKRRLAQNIISLIKELDISLNRLDEILSEETNAGRGTKIKNLSPFQVIVQSIYYQQKEKLTKFLRKRGENRYKLLTVNELNFHEINNIQKKNIIKI